MLDPLDKAIVSHWKLLELRCSTD